MSAIPSNIFSTKQNGLVIWLFGLSGSGKTTISTLLKQKLLENGFFSIALDGDVLREGINKDLGFSDEDRAENIRRAAEIAKLLLKDNVITICSFITPLTKHRAIASATIGAAYYEVFLDCPLAVCQQRDVKGLYKEASLNRILNFTGVTAKFEPSSISNLTIHTHTENPTQSTEKLFNEVLKRIK